MVLLFFISIAILAWTGLMVLGVWSLFQYQKTSGAGWLVLAIASLLVNLIAFVWTLLVKL